MSKQTFVRNAEAVRNGRQQKQSLATAT